MTVEVLARRQAAEGGRRSTPANLFTLRQQARARRRGRRPTGKHKVEFKQEGHGPALLQRLPDQLHPGGPDHQGRAGDQGRAQVLQAEEGRQDDQGRPASRGQAVDQKVEKYEREPLANLAMLKSGDLVEIELEIDSKNDYEYLVFEDMKPAGFEPVELRSGYNGNDLGAYMEFRDDRVVFFVRQLARGKHSVALPHAGRDPGQVQRPAHQGLGDVRPGTEGQLRRDQAPGAGLGSQDAP